MSILLRDGSKFNYNESQDIFLKKLYGSVIGRGALKVMTLPFVTKCGGMYMSSALSKGRIKKFIKQNNIDMSQYEEKDYHDFNDFFTRKIKEHQRTMIQDDHILISPCDGKLSAYPIDTNTILTIKDTQYKLDDLFMSPSISDTFKGGQALIFRLTVDDYHRYHFFDDGWKEEDHYIPGIFHTVNPVANDYYPIYKTNSRSYSLLHTAHFDDVVMMEVGAMMVGKITNHPVTTFKRGDEKGYFEFGGSTIVLLFKRGILKVDDDIMRNSKNNDETKVLLGEKVGMRIER